MLDRALAIRERLFGPHHPKVALTLAAAAYLAGSQQRRDDAEAAYRQRIAIYRKAFRDHHSWIGVARANLGTMEYHEEPFDVAERCLREALKSRAGTLPAEYRALAADSAGPPVSVATR